MAALVAAIHVLLSSCRNQDVDGREKPGHDDDNEVRFSIYLIAR
jgi:hypothetical protein